MPTRGDQRRPTSAASPSDAKHRAGGEERAPQPEGRHGRGQKPKRPQTTLRKRGPVRIDVRGATPHCINQIQIYENDNRFGQRTHSRDRGCGGRCTPQSLRSRGSTSDVCALRAASARLTRPMGRIPADHDIRSSLRRRPPTADSRLRAAVAGVDRNLPIFNIKTLAEYVAEQLWQPQQTKTLLAIFGVIAVVPAITGVYGIMAYAIRQRTHEIGIRVALGASRRDVLRLVIARCLLLITLGGASGLARSLPHAIVGDLAVGSDADRSPHVCRGNHDASHRGHAGVLSAGEPGLRHRTYGRSAV